jgi:hypothetical protein
VNCTSVAGDRTSSAVITVNPLPNNITNGFKASKMCDGDSIGPKLTYDADDTTFTSTVTSPYSITYKNNATLVQYTITIPSASPFSFTPGDSPTANAGYTLLSISNATCTNSDVNSFLDSGANLVIRPMPTASISGTTSVCVGASSPIITFTNPQTVTIKVTYAINSGLDQTIVVPPKSGAVNGMNSVTVPTTTGGSFVYSLKSVVYDDNTPDCSSTITGKSATVTVNPTPTITGATQPIFACVGSPARIKLTGLLPNTDSTISYTIAGDALQTIAVTADGSGVGYFDTRVLDVSPNDNNRNLNITGIASGSTPSCTKTLNIDISLKVNSNSGSIKLEGNAISGSTTFSELSTAHFSIDAIAGAATGYFWDVPSTWTITAGAGTNAITVTTGSYNDSGTVSVTANDSFCPSSVNVALSRIAPPAPVEDSKTPATCKVLGSITLRNLPPVGSWKLTTSKDGGTGVLDPTLRTGSTFTVSGLLAGSYTFIVTDDFAPSVASDPMVVTGVVSKTWNGTNWLDSTTLLPTPPPTDEENVVFAADYSESVSVNSCYCVIKPNAHVIIGSTLVLKIINGLNVDPAGSLTFNDKASLYQFDDDAVNNGEITYKRTTPGLKDLDYVYWSSPVKDQKLSNLYASDRYFKFINGDWKAQGGNDLMDLATGYIIRVRTDAPPFYQSVDFIGKPNNGIITVHSQGVNRSNLIGNPYPSAINARTFMTDNEPIVDGGLYFWTHTTARKLDVPSAEFRYTADDYAVFTLTGGGATAPSTNNPNTGTSTGVTPSGQIASGQSFFVISELDDYFTFTNSMRFDDANRNSQFFKQSNTKKGIKIEENRVWLNLTNDSGAFKQLLVGYVTGATNDFDKLYDAVTRNGNAFIDFYSVNNLKNYTIQGRGLPFNTADEVPLGYKSTIEGTFKIGIDNVDGSLVNQTIYLEDKLTNTIHDLKSGPYSFTTTIGAFKDRFVLRYTNTSKLGTGDPVIKQKGFFVSVKNREIKINSFDQIVNSVKVFDLKGSLLYERNKVNKNEFSIDTLTASSQFMVVMVQLEDGKWISEEIIFHD